MLHYQQHCLGSLRQSLLYRLIFPQLTQSNIRVSVRQALLLHFNPSQGRITMECAYLHLSMSYTVRIVTDCLV